MSSRLMNGTSLVVVGAPATPDQIATAVPPGVAEAAAAEPHKAPPRIAADPVACRQIAAAARHLPTRHELHLGDARTFAAESESVDLVVTSPPYWTIKEYNDREGQLARIADYDAFCDALDKVWRMAYEALRPGGRMVIVVDDVCLSRKSHGRHMVAPLHSSITERCRVIGFDNLTPILWTKVTNVAYENAGAGVLGKPYEPNGVIASQAEFVLVQRKPGYRRTEFSQRLLSIISVPDYQQWFQQSWSLSGASSPMHPAPFPLEVAERAIRMFSFVGDTVLDPFLGTGTTSLAAARWGRNSVGVEIDPMYHAHAVRRLRRHAASGSQMEMALGRA